MADNQETWTLILDGNTGQWVPVRQRLADANGQPGIGTFSSPDEAESAAQQIYSQHGLAPAARPAQYQTRQALENTGQLPGGGQAPAGTPGGPTPDPMIQGISQDQRSRLVQAAFPEGTGMSPLPGSPEEAMFAGAPGIGETGGSQKPERIQPAGQRYQAEPIPVDMYSGQDVLAGTWAENTSPGQFNQIISGTYRSNPEAAAELMAQGQDSGYLDQATRNSMADYYANYGNIAALQSGGVPLSDPLAYHAQAGDYATGWLNFDRAEGNLNYGGLWDNQFSDSYQQYADDLTAQSQDPREEQKNLVLSNIISMSPNMGPEMTDILMSRVEQEYSRYLASGSTTSFTQWLREVGADQWL